MPTFDPIPVPLARQAKTIVVARYDADLSPPLCYDPLPNVLCTQVQWREGADPGVARFRYAFNPQVLGDEYPSRVEHVLSYYATGDYRYLVKQDDRIVVFAFDADGEKTILFDGFAQIPQADLSRTTESVTFQALGVAVREWDEPLGGAIYREGPDPSVESDVATYLPARFNPDGIGNASPTDGNTANVGDEYPTFCDHKLDPDTRRHWDLAKAFRYVCVTGQADSYQSDYTTTFVDFSIADALLDSRQPKTDQDFDPNDPATYDSAPIIVQDIDVTGKPWPVAAEELVKPHNIGVYFRCMDGLSGHPDTRFNLYRRDGGDGEVAKECFLQEPGSTFDPAMTNVGEIHLSRDASQVRNRIVMDTDPTLYEIGAVLVPGFTVSSGDAATPAKYRVGDPLHVGDDVDKYRVYHFAEAGDEWYDFTGGPKQTVTSLDDVFGEPYELIPGDEPIPRYAARRRKVAGRLLSAVNGKAFEAQLWISKNYAGARPGLWDGTGQWQRVATSTWSLLDDRIGIRIMDKDVADWNVGKPSTAHADDPAPSGKFNLLQSQSSPTTAAPRVYFRLTCVIEDDEGIDAVAIRRISSSTKFEITSRMETRDRFRKKVIHSSSPFVTSSPRVNSTVLDETDDAQAYAEALRNARECATMAGTIIIPRFSNAYRVGDRIRRIKGRDIDLSVTVAREQGEASRYPMVVGVTWDFDGRQTTTLQLSDMRAGPARERTG